MAVSAYRCDEWASIGMETLGEAELFRHFMFLGETGSGKTASGIKPLCRMAFGEERLAAGLVVDPKGELGDYLQQLLGEQAAERLIRLSPGSDGPVLWQFEHRPIEGLGGAGILEQMMAVCDQFQQQTVSNDRFWFDTSQQLLASLLDLEVTLWRHQNNKGVENIRQFWHCFYGLLLLMRRRHTGAQELRLPGAQRVSPDDKDEPSPASRLEHELVACLKARDFGPRLQQMIDEHLDQASVSALPGYCQDNFLAHYLGLLSLSTSGIWLRTPSEWDVLKKIAGISCGSEVFNQFWALLVLFAEQWKIDDQPVFSHQQRSFFSQYTFMAEGTYSSIYAVVSSLVSELVTPEFCSRISLNPFEPPAALLSTAAVISQGRVVVYEPGLTTSVALTIGKMLKAGFFKALLNQQRLNQPDCMPFFYICDEFQRFITFDEESGEQSFLDRCRAYRVCCGLATQSVASLRYLMSNEAGLAAIKIMMVNTGTKLFFRTTDADTAESLTTMLPAPAREGKLHLVRVRPPTTLRPGECYYLQASGRSGRGQIRLGA
jgi:hypothetical protein